jgi:RNA polymerase sigma-70 factor (ECF subfamily)
MRSTTAPAELLGELLVAVGHGDERAFRRLYEATSRPLLGILIGKIGRRDVAEEALQECFMKIWQKADSYDAARGSAMTWLATLVRNRAIDVIRARRPDESGPDLEIELAGWADEGADPCRDAESAQHMHDLREPLAALAPQVRASVLLTCYAGYTHSESARLMSAPLGTVKSWVRRGLEQLRSHPGAPQFDSNTF